SSSQSAPTTDFDLDLEAGAIEPVRPFSALVRADLGGLSHIGNVRPSNQDHFLVARAGRSWQTILSNLPDGYLPDRFDEVGYVLAVADGRGGTAGGEVASRMAITRAVNLVLHAVRWNLRLDPRHAQEMLDRLAEYFREIDSTLTRQAQADPTLADMGTTL